MMVMLAWYRAREDDRMTDKVYNFFFFKVVETNHVSANPVN
jgi:hypothetical protein